MNIEAQPGINYKLYVAVKADMLDVEKAKELMLLVHRYVETSADFTDTPKNCWLAIRDSVLTENPDSLLIILKIDERSRGFLFCTMSEKNKDMALINGAYLDVKGHVDAVIDEAISMFEKWAKYKGATKVRFYTFRVPGAHKLMERRGWTHTLTVYNKEL